jgi:hypothetical protein
MAYIILPQVMSPLELVPHAADLDCTKTGFSRCGHAYMEVEPTNKWVRNGNTFGSAESMTNTLEFLGVEAFATQTLEPRDIMAAEEVYEAVKAGKDATKKFYKENGFI